MSQELRIKNLTDADRSNLTNLCKTPPYLIDAISNSNVPKQIGNGVEMWRDQNNGDIVMRGSGNTLSQFNRGRESEDE